MGHIVWIVGSGASVALGGPTLRSLLSWEAGAEVEQLVRRDAEIGKPGCVFDIAGRDWIMSRRLYHHGMRYIYGQGPTQRFGEGENLWPDAEAYLDALETAASDPKGSSARVLNGLIAALIHQWTPQGPVPGIPAVLEAARRAVAIECSKFLLAADVGQERWAPYKSWRDLLHAPTHRATVITFNYDRVLETLQLEEQAVLPGPLEQDWGSKRFAVFKLHGSVDWKRTRPGNGSIIYERSDDPRLPFTAQASELVIATPGTGKQQVAKELESLWTIACGRLRTASAVVFLGYRFPPTDAAARECLLRALPEGNVAMHIVLGGSASDADTMRMQALLSFARPRAWVRPHALRAEDFLSVATTEQILDNSRRVVV